MRCTATSRSRIINCQMVITTTARRKTPGTGSHPTSFGPCPGRVTPGVILEHHGINIYPLIIPLLGRCHRRSSHRLVITISVDLRYRQMGRVDVLITTLRIIPTTGL